MGEPMYYPRRWTLNGSWAIWKRARGGGDRRIAVGVSERYARRIARLLNEDGADG